MSAETSFRLPRLLLPKPGIDLRKWAVIACDQHTAEPEYWQSVEREVGDAPSTLRLIFPEAYLGATDAEARIGRIHETMRAYVADGLFREQRGAVYVERTLGRRVRRGLMLELDLDQYDFAADSMTPIRPTEGTMVERLAPRIAVRRAADLELPHVLVLIDDPAGSVIEPIGAERASLTKLYDTELMLGAGRVAGYAVDATRGERAAAALRSLAHPQAFAARYGVPEGTPVMLFAMGDGNHSLATAKACWDSIKASASSDHPGRYALVEVENIHDPALQFSPIHRLLFGVAGDIRQVLKQEFGSKVSFTDVASGEKMRQAVRDARGPRHVAGLVGPGARFALAEVAKPQSTLAVGTFQSFIDRFVESAGAASVDYVHGDESLERLAQEAGNIGFHLPTLTKDELLRMVVRGGPLPRKTFSMGEADEKRFYVEARRIRLP